MFSRRCDGCKCPENVQTMLVVARSLRPLVGRERQGGEGQICSDIRRYIIVLKHTTVMLLGCLDIHLRSQSQTLMLQL
jgi:hypothetical protein